MLTMRFTVGLTGSVWRPASCSSDITWKQDAARGGQRLVVERDRDDVAQFEVAGHAEVLEVGRARELQRAADALGAGGVDGEDALAIIEFEFAGAAGDGLAGVIHERRQIGHFRRARFVDEAHVDPARVMDERVDALAGLHLGAPRHVCQAQFVQRGVLRQRRAFEVKQVGLVQFDLGEHLAGGHQPAPVDQRRGRELAHHRGRHQGPLLHPESRLHRPAAAVEREVDDAIAVLQRAVGREVERRLGAVAVRPAEGRLGNHRGFPVVVRVHHRMDELPGLRRVRRVEAQGAAVGVSVAVAHATRRRCRLCGCTRSSRGGR